MRRREPIRNRPLPRGLFQGRERSRILVMIGMLVVMVMLIARARDPQMWTWLTGEEKAESGEQKAEGREAKAEAAEHKARAPRPREAVVPGPTDLDPDQREAIEEEFLAVTDKQPLDKFEMLAYWRLLRWARAQPYDELARRASRTITYADLWERPDKFRGRLVAVRLHLRRARIHDELEDVELHVPGLKAVHEAWGWDERSHPFSYAVICPELPGGMRRGQYIEEDAEFVGYFLKLIPFIDKEAKTRATPLLIGRLRWNPPKPGPTAEEQLRTALPVLVVGGLVAIGLVIGGALWSRHRPARPAPRPGLRADGGPIPAVDDWLDRAQSRAEGGPAEITPPDPPDSDTDDAPGSWLDHPEPGER